MSLELVFLEDSSQKFQFIFKDSFKEGLYITSDIKSKDFMESQVLKNQDFFYGNRVARSSDFLKEMLKFHSPEWQIFSNYFIEKVFLKFKNESSKAWVKNINSSRIFFQYFNLFLPILSHPESLSLMQEWLHNSKESKKWENWYTLSQSFFKFLEEKKWIHEDGVKGVLLNSLSASPRSFQYPRRIFIDLGISFDGCEQEIFKIISSQTDVTFFIPKIKQNIFSQNSSSFYEVLTKTSSASEEKLVSPSKEQVQFSSQVYETSLGEVKQVVAQVSAWIREGVPLKEIAILAPHIEYFWPCLQPHLEKEGIQFRKKFSNNIN